MAISWQKRTSQVKLNMTTSQHFLFGERELLLVLLIPFFPMLLYSFRVKFTPMNRY